MPRKTALIAGTIALTIGLGMFAATAPAEGGGGGGYQGTSRVRLAAGPFRTFDRGFRLGDGRFYRHEPRWFGHRHWRRFGWFRHHHRHHRFYRYGFYQS